MGNFPNGRDSLDVRLQIADTPITIDYLPGNFPHHTLQPSNQASLDGQHHDQLTTRRRDAGELGQHCEPIFGNDVDKRVNAEDDVETTVGKREPGARGLDQAQTGVLATRVKAREGQDGPILPG